ncbi:hypothetical protein K144316041_13880 [Clostridium tetani]|uniref:pyridoxal-dependent decarboxylase n=1 Tax=Clostridium tetani TaxID=1513 RepID=UPI0029545BC9|nr:pyridoxal-dependent decarboxylase [Clostridium tetani]BDR72680.1 hypothetical protein K144316041_13880 [Clostridium tetani]
MKNPMTQPTKDPNTVYPKVPGIDYDKFKLSEDKMTSEQINDALEELHNYISNQQTNFLGYQINQSFNYMKDLKEYLNVHMNNIGDPFVSGNFTVNTKFLERAVLDYFASLWNAQWPHESKGDSNTNDWENSYWGYVVSMGSTEANFFGIWNARDYLSGKALLLDTSTHKRAKSASVNGNPQSVEPRVLNCQAKSLEDNPNMYTPIAFYSQDTHYSIIKGMRILNFTTFNEAGSGKFECPLKYPEDYPKRFSINYLDENGWPFEVPSNNDGSVFIPALKKLVEAFASKGYPIFVNFNYGTTFKGSYDNVEKAINELVPILKKYGLYEREIIFDKDNKNSDTRTGFWFHVDGALGAAYMPFLEMTTDNEDFPVFDFRLKDVHSISMSGHKWIGVPWPCGIYMSKIKYQLLPPDNPNYIGSPDSTFAGSRNAFSSLILWYYIATHSYEDCKNMILDCQDTAKYTVEKLNELSKKSGIDLWVEYSSKSLTIRFKEANPDIVFKYSLSGEILYVNGEKRAYSHIYIMPHVTKNLIDKFIEDLSKPGAFPEQVSHLEKDDTNFNSNSCKGIYVPQTGRGFK